MAYETGTASSQEDLMTKFRTFLIANGWTSDDFDTTDDHLAVHQGGVYVQMHWDNTDDIAVFQSLSHDGSNPGSNPDDSGNNAQATGAITVGHRMNTISNGPFIGHHFFTDNSSEIYAYMAVEVQSGVWRFMGFGELVKQGSWTGGEFSFGTLWNQGGGQINAYLGSNHSLVCDAHALDHTTAGFLHMEGLPGMDVDSKWGIYSYDTGGYGTDDAGEPRYGIIGGSRGGVHANAYQWFALSSLQGLTPLLPIPSFYWRQDTTPDHFILLGHLPDFRQLNIKWFVPEQEITIGSDTWIIFPFNAKVFDLGQPSINQSGNAGYAIKKVT